MISLGAFSASSYLVYDYSESFLVPKFFEPFSQVKAAWEELEARREEFLKEKKVLAHLGFY